MRTALMALVLCIVVPRAAVGATERRLALVVGNNIGQPNEVRLRFAHRDATRFAQVLRELGQVQHDDLVLLLETDADRLMAEIRKIEAIAADTSGPVTLVFYYSGHSSDDGLHLGTSVMSWDGIRDWLKDSEATLRIALVDACQSGSLAKDKGLQVIPAIANRELQQRGTALLVSTESTEVAQESLELGGSFFTHFLVSGLRGAADANRDGRVTLAEAQTFTTQNTLEATGTWARRVQRPLFDFDISGHGDIVLSYLDAGAATLALGKDLDGRLMITERSSSLVVAESQKRSGEALILALPAGRYVAHLRQPLAIQVAQVSLPWGGSTALDADDFTAHSYQAVATKGASIEINTNRLRLGGGVRSGALQGESVVPMIRLGVSTSLAPLELGLRATAAYRRFDTEDTVVTNRIFGFGAVVGGEIPLRFVDFRFWGLASLNYWHQSIELHTNRKSLVPALGLGAGVRIPLLGDLFAELSAESIVYFLERTDESPAALTIAGMGDLGVMF